MGSELTSWLAFDVSLLMVFVPLATWLLWLPFERYRRTVGQYARLWGVLVLWLILHALLLVAVFLWYRDRQDKAQYDTVLILVHADIVPRALVPMLLEWNAPRTAGDADPPSRQRLALWLAAGAVFLTSAFAWINFGLAIGASATAEWVLFGIYALVTIVLAILVVVLATRVDRANDASGSTVNGSDKLLPVVTDDRPASGRSLVAKLAARRHGQ
jgi:uncharacterized membrane protein